MRAADGGKLTDADKAKLTNQQNRLSDDIYKQKHDAQVQPKTNNEVNTRDRLQQERIGQGIKSGQLTAGEASNLEKKEANLNKEERTDAPRTAASSRRVRRARSIASRTACQSRSITRSTTQRSADKRRAVNLDEL